MTLNKIRSFLYRAASVLGDINAVAKGKVLERLARKSVTKNIFTTLNKLFRRL